MAQWPASMGSIAPGMYYGMPGGGLTSSQPAFPGMQPQSMMPIAAHSRGMVTTAAPIAPGPDNSWAFPQTAKVTYQPQNKAAPVSYVAKKSISPKKKGEKRRKDPNAPKKPPPAFLKWATEERGEIKKQVGNLAPPDMSKELGHRWAALNPEVKQFYQERYAIDKIEYDRAKEAYKAGLPFDPNTPMHVTHVSQPKPVGHQVGQQVAVQYNAAGNVKKRRNKKCKRLRDPNAPKKPAPAFLKWSMEERGAVKQEHGNLKPGDMGKELGRRWAVLNPGIKQLYHDRYQQDKKDYDEARGKYNPSQDYLRQKGSNAPKKPPPSFLKWSMYERVEVKKELGNISVTEMGKELGRRWAALTPEVKQVYKERYHQEKEMYNQARANYVPSEYELSLQKVKKSKRDPNSPKKPAPAFLKWSADEREEVKKQLGNLSPADMSKVLGKRWGMLAPEVKQFYQERYAVEKEEWDIKRKSSSVKAIKDPAAPKKPAPAFLKWAQDERQIVKKQLGNLSPGNMGKVLGKRWAELSPHVKQIYQDRYKRCKIEYDFARANYEPSKAFLRKKNQIEEMRGEQRIKTEMEQNRNYHNSVANPQVRPVAHQQPGHPTMQQPAEVSWQDVPDTRWVTNNMPTQNSVKKEVKSELKEYYASFR